MFGRFIFIVLIIWVTIMFALCFKTWGADTFSGVGVFVGSQMQNAPIAHVSEHYDWEEFQVKPIYGYHLDDRWDLWVEGLVGLVNYTDTQSIKMGALLMTSYDIVKIKETKVYTEIGVGTGWCNYSPSTRLLRPNLLGFIDGGVGIKYPIGKGWLTKVGIRFHHTSAMFARDTGINSYGCEISFIK